MPNGNGHHWSKFWWKDWDADEGLKMCCFAAQGLWMRLLCIMHKANPIGHLLVNGRSPNPRQIVALCGGNEKEIRQLLDELEENGVFSRNDDGVIFSRRMVRDAVASDAGREFVARRWNGNDPNGTPNTPPNRVPTERPKRPPKKDPTPEPITKKLEADSEAEAEKEREELEINSGSFSEARARVSTDDRSEAQAAFRAYLARKGAASAADEPIKTSDKIVVLNHVGKVKRAMASTANRAQGRKAERTPEQQDRELKHGPPELVPEIIPPQRIREAERSRAEQYAQILGISLDEANEHLGITPTIEGCVALGGT